MEEHAKTYSQSYKYDLKADKKESFWSKNFDQMAFKTMLRQLLGKWGIMSLEMQTGFIKDESAEKDGKIEYVDNQDLTAGLENMPIDYGNIQLDDDESGKPGVNFEEPEPLFNQTPQSENNKDEAKK